ncbi:FtsW/RodA/SpoVE family cell cycle protein, partial [bacterium]|nr:FtsW/RodA/SpoVE family cell cycle protein [bacterium]
LTLPFISYGGSSLVTCMFLVGVMLSLAGQPPQVFVWRKKRYG